MIHRNSSLASGLTEAINAKKGDFNFAQAQNAFVSTTIKEVVALEYNAGPLSKSASNVD